MTFGRATVGILAKNLHTCPINECTYCTPFGFVLAHHINNIHEAQSSTNNQTTSNYYKCSDDIESYKCSKCDAMMLFKVNMAKHVNTTDHKEKFMNYVDEFEEEPDVFSCNKCGFKTCSTYVLRKHNKEICHKIKSKSRKEKSDDVMQRKKGRFQCDKCNFSTKILLRFVQHLSDIHGEETSLFSCQLCSFITQTQRNLHSHLCKAHYDNPPASIKIHTCDIPNCDYRTISSAKIEGHKLRQHFICDICGRAETTLKRLTLHKEKHTRNEFKCEKCPFDAKEKHLLHKHLMDEHPEGLDAIMKLYKCQYCSYKTPSFGKLTAHITRLRHLKKGHQ